MHRSWIAWSVVFALHLAVPFVLLRWHTNIPDENAYVNLAENLAQKGSFHLDFVAYWHAPGQPYTHVAPGWPFLLAIGYKLGGQIGLWLVPGLVGCLSAVLAYVLGRQLGLAEKWCWALVAWLTLNPLYLYFCHAHLMTEAAVLPLGLGIMIVGIRFLERPTARNAALLAAVAAAGHLTRSQTMLPVIAVWLIALFVVPWRRLFPLGFLFAAVHLALLAPWLYRMQQVGATPYSTELKLGINLYQFSGAKVDNPYSKEGATIPLPQGVEAMTPAERNAVLTREALRGVVENPLDYLRKCGLRANFLFSPVPNFAEVSRVQYYGVLLSSLLFFFVPLGAALLRLAFLPRLSRAQVLLLVTLLLWYAFHVLVNASIRNRLPSDVFCAALALSLWTAPRPLRTGVQLPRGYGAP